MFQSYSPAHIIDQPDNGSKTTVTYTNSSYPDLNSRLQTYNNWPKPEVSKINLAKAGFIYTGQDDVVICPYCNVEGFRWEVADNPMADHRGWSPHCPFLRSNVDSDSTSIARVNQVTSPRGNQDTCGLYGIEVVPNSVPVDLQRLGIQASRGPSYTDKVTLESRLKTFQHWPQGIKQRPAQLAEAGFFYTGFGDQTLCYSCGGGLQDWLEKDDPWEQHALWFGKCKHVNLKKGPEFVAKVKAQNQPQAYSPSNSTSTETKEESVAAAVETLSEQCEKVSVQEQPGEHKTICKICYKNELGVVFLPCGHIVACVDCAPALSTCAVCRKPLEATVRAYLS